MISNLRPARPKTLVVLGIILHTPFSLGICARYFVAVVFCSTFADVCINYDKSPVIWDGGRCLE